MLFGNMFLDFCEKNPFFYPKLSSSYVNFLDYYYFVRNYFCLNFADSASRSNDREAGDIRHSGPSRACRATSTNKQKKQHKRGYKGEKHRQQTNKK